ncbi:MAG: GNAT family N-acetyltransferase [Myxococcota bacterium]
MGGPLLIRPAVDADRPALLSLHRSLYQAHRDAVVPAQVRELIAYRDYEEVVANDLDSLLRTRSCHVLVGEIDDALVGYITARTEVEPQRVLSRRATLEDWYVEPSHRMSGVGAALLQALESKLESLGCDVLESGTWSTNEGGRRAHDAFGFLETRVSYRKRLRRE